MSRSGYTDDCDDTWQHIRYRGAVASATRGKRGQRLLRELRDALDAMPVKRLISRELECEGEVCALGALGRARCVDMADIDPNEPEEVAAAFDVAEALAREVVYENDEGDRNATPEERWEYMRRWVDSQIEEKPSP